MSGVKEEGSSSGGCREKCEGKRNQLIRLSNPSSRFNNALIPTS